MSTVDDVDELIGQYHLALGEFMKGNPEPVQKLFSHREDVSLANPCGPPFVGGSRSPRLRSMPRRYAEMARQLASRS
jgi:hypothetical protein